VNTNISTPAYQLIRQPGQIDDRVFQMESARRLSFQSSLEHLARAERVQILGPAIEEIVSRSRHAHEQPRGQPLIELQAAEHGFRDRALAPARQVGPGSRDCHDSERNDATRVRWSVRVGIVIAGRWGREHGPRVGGARIEPAVCVSEPSNKGDDGYRPAHAGR
jgi:hypothetical protein